MWRVTSRIARQAATAVVLVTSAAWSSAHAGALEPEMLPQSLWWRGDTQVPIAQDPLMSTLAPGAVRFSSEWAPLYAASDGGRLERSRHALRVTWLPGPWRAGLELESGSGVARSGEARTRIGAEEPQAYVQSLAIAHDGRRLRIGAGASQNNGRAGWSLAARADLAPRTHATLGWSRLPERGRGDVWWEDVRVTSEGSWDDQRVTWRLDAKPRPGLALWVGQRALDRHAAADPGASRGDRLVPALAWRASQAGVDAWGPGARWTAELQYGEGRERTSIVRGDTPYATLTGPVFNVLATMEARPVRLPFAARAWAGRWSGDARASVAMWPFDAAGALLGTRRVARSAASLEHGGVSVDYLPVHNALDGGLALSRFVPRADYQSWQSTLLGLGHDDESSGEAGVRGAWLLGTRVATNFTWHRVRTRLEAVQWIPLRLDRSPARGDAGAPAGGGSSGGPGWGSAENARGGTVLRVAIETSD